MTPAGGGPDDRNSARKDNEFFTFDWRIMRPFRFGNGYELIPTSRCSTRSTTRTTSTRW